MNILAPPSVDEFFLSADGTQLHYEWHEPSNVRAVVVVLPGYGDHAGRYRELAARLMEEHVGVMALDYRGQGNAAGQRGHCSQFTEYLIDLASACVLARQKVPGVPLGLVGHSHGGLIALRALCDPRFQDCHVPAVLSSPYLKLRRPVSVPKVWLGHLASRVAPRLALAQGIPSADMTRDPEMLMASRRDGLIHHWATARWFTESLRAQRYVAEHLEDIRTPTLWLVASADRVSDPEATLKAYGLAGGRKHLHVYENYYHEVFHEVDRARVFSDVRSWLAAHLLQG